MGLATLDFRDDPPAAARGGVVTIGNFDGVHLGHRRLLSRLRAEARRRGLPAIAISFERHPLQLLRPESAPTSLCRPDRKSDLLRAAGVDGVVLYRPTHELLQLSAHEFFQQILRERLAVRGIVEGPDFRFGRGRAGDVAMLRQLCDANGMSLDIVDTVSAGDAPISSSRVRLALSQGDVAGAGRLLGRPHRIRGLVVAGDRRGQTIGFPTANLADVDVMIPAVGVYAVRVWRDGQPCVGACNIGPNPTFGVQSFKVETHLLDFDGDLYGRWLEQDFLARLRDTRPFAGVEELKRQLALDVAAAREIALRLPAEIEPAHELALTIEQWLLDEYGKALVGTGGGLRSVDLASDGCLRLVWNIPQCATPTDLHEILFGLEDRLRVVFPEVQRIASTSCDP